jgi:hypothetical protein
LKVGIEISMPRLVDIKKNGLNYELTELPKAAIGCDIEIDLYEPLSERAMFDIRDEIGKLVKYVSIPVTVNDDQVNTPPEDCKWDAESDGNPLRPLNSSRNSTCGSATA